MLLGDRVSFLLRQGIQEVVHTPIEDHTFKSESVEKNRFSMLKKERKTNHKNGWRNRNGSGKIWENGVNMIKMHCMKFLKNTKVI